jgi:hypothetical protein
MRVITNNNCLLEGSVIRGSNRAISPVVSTLLIVSIVVVASLVTYAWVQGYMEGITQKIENAIQILNLVSDHETGNLIVYVQNIGQRSVILNPSSSVYVNDNPQAFQGEDLLTISPGQTKALLLINYAVVPNEQIRVKVVTSEGIFAQMTGTAANPAATPVGTPSVTPSPSPSGEPITPIFSSGWENSGGTDPSDGGVWNAGVFGNAAIVKSPVKSGEYGVDLPFSGSTFSILEKELSGTVSQTHYRFYVYFSTFAANPTHSSLQDIAVMTTSDWSHYYYVGLDTGETGGASYWSVFDAYNNRKSTSSIALNTGQWYCVEFAVLTGSSGGYMKLWIDGNLAYTQNIDTSGTPNVGYLFLGSASYNYNANTAFFDDLVVAPGYIGPLP